MNETEVAKEARTKSIKIDDPAEEFADWAYAIPEHHYAIFGVRYQQFMKDKVPYFSWAKSVPPPRAFIVGDVFHLRSDESTFIQVAADWDALRLEVHCGLVGINVPRLRPAGNLISPKVRLGYFNGNYWRKRILLRHSRP
jgi:hypothetical protein